ncbi:MAG: substrate-binding domain-containing protein [Eubacteriales bacterium]|nr:substrate-binding domain-containing protein [Eubacteriales bacterium]
MNTLYVLMEPVCMKQALYLSSLEGIRKAFKKHNIKIKIVNYPEQINLADSEPAAVIISISMRWTMAVAEKLRHINIRPILVGAAVDSFEDSFSGPTIDRYDLVYKQIDYLLSAGCHRIAFIGNEDNDINDNIRKQAFLHTMKGFKLPVSKSDIFSYVDGNGDCIEHFLNFSKRYDGAICVNDYIGVELLYRAKKFNINIPSDLLVIGSGDFQISQTIKPSLSTTTLDYYKMGCLTADILQTLKNNPYVDKVQITLPCEIVVRESTKNLPYCSAKTQLAFINHEEAYLGHPKNFGQNLLTIEMGLSNCTKTDLAILDGVGRGISIDSIAEDLFMSVGAINYRLKKLYNNFHADNKAELETMVRNFMPLVANLMDEK